MYDTKSQINQAGFSQQDTTSQFDPFGLIGCWRVSHNFDERPPLRLHPFMWGNSTRSVVVGLVSTTVTQSLPLDC